MSVLLPWSGCGLRGGVARSVVGGQVAVVGVVVRGAGGCSGGFGATCPPPSAVLWGREVGRWRARSGREAGRRCFSCRVTGEFRFAPSCAFLPVLVSRVPRPRCRRVRRALGTRVRRCRPRDWTSSRPGLGVHAGARRDRLIGLVRRCASRPRLAGPVLLQRPACVSSLEVGASSADLLAPLRGGRRLSSGAEPARATPRPREQRQPAHRYLTADDRPRHPGHEPRLMDR
jgi:hypothetical protein